MFVQKSAYLKGKQEITGQGHQKGHKVLKIYVRIWILRPMVKTSRGYATWLPRYSAMPIDVY